VRSGPSLERLKILPPKNELKRGRKYLVGYVGVMGRQEGIDYLLRAAAHIVYDLGRTDVHFGLVGGGTSLEEMRRLAGELGVAGYVTFTGRVPDAELLTMLSTADVCVNPDIANEMNDISTMNKVMEYMALGKPIVQFDLAEGRFSAGEASLYARRNNAFDLAEKIVSLLENPGRRRAMGEFGRRRVQNELEWRHEAPKLLAAYAALWGLVRPDLRRPAAPSTRSAILPPR
jgi:glycosyltransferase involved in cell wall biosynthesis